MTTIGRLASLLLLGIFGSTYAQVTKKQPPKQPLAATSPSLNETTDFIVGKLDGLTAVFEFYFTFSGKRALDVQGEQIMAPRATECQLTWVQSRILRCHIPNVPSSCGGGGTVRFTPTLQLSEMSPTVKVLPTPDPGNTDLKIVRGVYALVLDATHDQQVTSE